jgi:UDPglucose 6-dehydrogenase
MNISIIGTGYVGLVTGVCLAKFNHNVICLDIDQEKVNQINNSISPIYEEQLNELLVENKERIYATSSYEKAIKNSDITFICVGTPSKDNGEIDLKYINDAVIAVAEQLKNKNGFHSIIVKSTVIPGTTEKIVLPLIEKYSDKTVGIDIGLGMNPEFLREGVAVNDFLNPDRIVIGYFDDKTKNLLIDLYESFSCPVFETSLSAAEMIKYASNIFLATKISFINEIGNMCKSLGVNTYEVADGIGLDKRIERSFLNSGIGWGGSCFPKDTKALQAWSKNNNESSHMIDSVIKVNDEQPLKLIDLLKKHIPDLRGIKIGILGLAFKPDTDDIRDSRSIPVIKELLKNDVRVIAYDPKAIDNFKKIYPNITYSSSAKEVLNADAVLITTAWEEFKNLDYSKKIVIDGRGIKEARNALIYEGVCW